MVHLPNSGLSVAGIRHFGKYIWNPATVIFQGGFRNFCGFTFQENAIQKCGVISKFTTSFPEHHDVFPFFFLDFGATRTNSWTRLRLDSSC